MTDLRLVPAAVVVWVACVLGVGWSATTLAVASGGCLGCALVVGVAARGLRRGRAGIASAWLAVVAAGVALGSCAAQVHVRDDGALAELVAEHATVTVTGTVRGEAVPIEGPWDDSSVRFVVGVDEVTGRGVTAEAAAPVVVVADDGVPYGARVSVTGRLTPADPGDDVTAVLRATSSAAVVAPPGPLDRAVGRMRAALLDVTDGLPDDQRGLVPGAAIGDTTRLPADLDQAMRDVSLTHITAVSGGHFAVLSLAVLALTALLRLPGWARALVTAVAMAGFVVLVHPDPSVVRAAAMGAIGVLGMVLGRPSSTVPALGCSVVLLLVVDPWLARSFGFVLSVLATAAIAVLGPVIAARLAVLPRWLAVAIAVPTAAQVVCGPVLVLLDPSVSVYSVPANLLAAPALLPATVLGVMAALLAPLCPPLAGCLAHAAGAATWWIATVARVGAGLPGARHVWPSGPLGALALLLVTAGLACIGPALRRWGLRAAVVVAAVALAANLTPGMGTLLRAWPPSQWRVVMCDVGQGDALVVRSGDGAGVVVDVGPAGGAADACLDELGVTRIDLLVLTHHHEDHVGGLQEVLRDRSVVQALVSPLAEPADQAEATFAALDGAGVAFRTADGLGSGRSGTAGDVAWTVLGPGRVGLADPAQANDASLVVLLRAPDLTVLALGDAGPAPQDRLASLLSRQPELLGAGVDVVKVAHHGSAYQSDRLIELLAPPVALVSVGLDNDYGHPAERTVAAYRGTGALVLGTHECGPVAVARTGDGGGLAVSARCVDSPDP
jgi:competence protein ComEC